MKRCIKLLLVLGWFAIVCSAQAMTVPDTVFSNVPNTDKSIFVDISVLEWIGIILVPIMAGLSNAGGIGGSEIQLVMMIILFGDQPSEAVRFVYGIGFAGVFANSVIRGTMREPTFQTPVVNYDILMICVPLLVLGSKIGTLANQTAPEIIPTVILFCTALAMTVKLYKSITADRRMRKKKMLRQSMEDEQYTDKLKNYISNVYNDMSFKEGPKLSDPGQTKEFLMNETKRRQFKSVDDIKTPFVVSQVVHGDGLSHVQDKSLKYNELMQRERRLFPWEVYLYFFLLIGCSFLWEMLRGNPNFHSIVGVEYCKTGYWMIYASNVLVALVFYCIATMMLRRRRFARTQLNDALIEKHLNPAASPAKLSIVAICVGILAGVVGMGGALIFAPLMIGWGLTPLQATGTSTFISLFTAMTPLFAVIISHAVNYSDLFIFMALAFFGSSVIANAIVWVAKKLKKQYILSYILLGFLFFLVGFNFIYTIYKLAHDYSEVTQVKKLC